MPDKSSKEIIDKIKNSPHNKIRIAVTDIDGILRGKLMHKDKFLSVAADGFGFCDVVFGWDSSDVAYDNSEYTGWHTGYPDAQACLDLNTYRTIPWQDNLPLVLADFRNKDKSQLEVCPRSLLKKVKKDCLDAGYYPFFSQEFEWFNFENTSEELQETKFRNLRPITPGMFGYSILRSSLNSGFFNELFELLEQFDVPLEGLHTETGPGVYEAAIQYSGILEAADRAILFKTGVKEIAYRHGIIASFMAKWNDGLPGCGGHVHQSLWDDRKRSNLFYDGKDKEGFSKLMRSYLAGQLYCLPYILPFFAPTINSYKRLVEGAWAPTTLTWGIDNRTTAFRVLPGGTKSTRLETRVIGSDTNPYLAMAACLASGLYGVKNKLKLETPMTIGNGYRDIEKGVLPATLKEATDNMKNSDIPKELFGEKFVDHFARTREWEWRQYLKVITDWELKRYFEII